MDTCNILFSIAGIAVVIYFLKNYQDYNKSKETYKDPLWMEPPKMYQDYYTRSGGSVYGEQIPDLGGVKWNMFSGLNSNDSAY